jgi:hypothetical protein
LYNLLRHLQDRQLLAVVCLIEAVFPIIDSIIQCFVFAWHQRKPLFSRLTKVVQVYSVRIRNDYKFTTLTEVLFPVFH